MARSLAATAADGRAVLRRPAAGEGGDRRRRLLLLTRRVNSARVYAEIDWSLLLMFAGLFIIVAGVESVLLKPERLPRPEPGCTRPVPALSLLTAALSNLVSNVPAVLVLKPFAAALPDP